MRGAAADAAGIKGMILHSIDEAPPPRSECDVELSAAYGPQRFEAYAKSAHLKTLEQTWSLFLDDVRKTAAGSRLLTSDMRHDTRHFIFEMIVTNQQYERRGAALIGSAIVWLAATSPAACFVGASQHIHYEITETGIVDGHRTQNFRLILNPVLG
jgi:hypothetical protein